MSRHDELIQITATQAVALLRKREISPLDLLDAVADRVDKVDGSVNALSIRFFLRSP